MSRSFGLPFLRRFALATCALALSATAQDFGDTPYVQTPQNVVDAMLRMANVGPQDYVVDLGSGDGRMVLTAARRYGARGFGVDLDTTLVEKANAEAARSGLQDRARFYAQDLYKTDVSRATVMTIYLLPEVNLMVRGKLFAELKPGTRIVSHDYDMGSWRPDRSAVLDAPDKPVGRDRTSKVFMWTVPANVTGSWRTEAGAGTPSPVSFAFEQRFQDVTGTAEAGGRRAALEQVQLRGDRLAFTVASAEGAPVRYEGRVEADSIVGTARRGDAPPQSWRAVRTGGRKAIGPEPDPQLSILKQQAQ